MSVKEEVIELIASFRERVPTTIVERLDSSIQVAQGGDEEVALEILCSNLDDFDVAVPRERLTQIVKLAKYLGLDADYWVRLERLVDD